MMETALESGTGEAVGAGACGSGEVRFEYTLGWDGQGRWRPTRAVIDLEPVSADDYEAGSLRENGCFRERDLLEHIATRGPRGGTYVDVGANIGNHSVYFGRFLADHVISIEPSPQVIPTLKRNLERNGVDNATVFTCGAGACAGRGRVVVPPGCEHHLGMTQLGTTAVDGGDDASVVEIATLDEIVERAGARNGSARVTFIKIDVEGMEMEVLRGARGLLEEHQPQLAIEVFTDQAFAAVSGFLEEFGYEAVARFCPTPTYHFINRCVHTLRTPPSRLARWWHRQAVGTGGR